MPRIWWWRGCARRIGCKSHNRNAQREVFFGLGGRKRLSTPESYFHGTADYGKWKQRAFIPPWEPGVYWTEQQSRSVSLYTVYPSPKERNGISFQYILNMQVAQLVSPVCVYLISHTYTYRYIFVFIYCVYIYIYIIFVYIHISCSFFVFIKVSMAILVVSDLKTSFRWNMIDFSNWLRFLEGGDVLQNDATSQMPGWVCGQIGSCSWAEHVFQGLKHFLVVIADSNFRGEWNSAELFEGNKHDCFDCLKDRVWAMGTYSFCLNNAGHGSLNL